MVLPKLLIAVISSSKMSNAASSPVTWKISIMFGGMQHSFTLPFVSAVFFLRLMSLPSRAVEKRWTFWKFMTMRVRCCFRVDEVDDDDVARRSHDQRFPAHDHVLSSSGPRRTLFRPIGRK